MARNQRLCRRRYLSVLEPPDRPLQFYAVEVSAKKQQRRLATTSLVGDALLAIANEDLEFAISKLNALSPDRDEAIHECRKAIKRLRAIARLGVAVSGASTRPAERRLRDAGRLLAPARDATAANNALVRLIEAEPGLGSLKHLGRISLPASDEGIPCAKALAKLDSVRKRLLALFANPETWTVMSMAEGIETTYAAAVGRMHRFERKQTDTRAHAWRKSVQRLSNQLSTIEALCSDHLGESLERLATLADVLGEHHDAAVLRARLDRIRKKLPEKTYAAVAAAAKSLQRELSRRALALGAGLFATTPQSFLESLLGACSGADSRR